MLGDIDNSLLCIEGDINEFSGLKAEDRDSVLRVEVTDAVVGAAVARCAIAAASSRAARTAAAPLPEGNDGMEPSLDEVWRG